MSTLAREMMLNAGCGPDPEGDIRMDMSVTGKPHVRGMVEHLPFKDGAFSCVKMHNVLEHTPSPGVVLSEARRVLRAGGQLDVKTDNAACLWYHVRLPLRFVEGHEYHGEPGDHHYMLFKAHHLRDMAAIVGFEGIRVKYAESATTAGASRLLRRIRPELVAQNVLLSATRPIS